MIKNYFLFAVALLQALAAVQYLRGSDWRLGLANLFISLASLMFSTIGGSR